MKERGMEEVGKDVMPEGKEIEVNIGKIMPKEQEIKENSGEIMPEEREPERGSDKTAQSKKQKEGGKRKNRLWNSRKFQNVMCLTGALLIVLSVMGELLLFGVMDMDDDFSSYAVGDVLAEVMTTSGYTDSQIYKDALFVEAASLATQAHARQLFETDGRYDEDKMIDLAYVSMRNEGVPETGITYRIGDLLRWKRSEFVTQWLIPQQFDAVYEKKQKDPYDIVNYEELNAILMNAAGVTIQKECVYYELALPTDGKSLYLHAGDLGTLSEYTSYLRELLMYVAGMYSYYADQDAVQGNLGIAVVNPAVGLVYSNLNGDEVTLSGDADELNRILYDYVTQKEYYAVHHVGTGTISVGKNDISLYEDALCRQIGLLGGERLYLVLDADFSQEDLLWRMGNWYGLIKNMTAGMFTAFIAGVCLFLTALIRRTMLEGREEAAARTIDNWFTILLPAILIPITGAIYIAWHFLEPLAEWYWEYYEIGNEAGIYLSGGGMFVLAAVTVTVVASFGLYFYLEMVHRIKKRTLYKKSLLRFILVYLKKAFLWIWSKLKKLSGIVDGKIKWVVGYLAFLFVNLIGVLIGADGYVLLLVVLTLADLAIGAAVLAYFKEQDALRKHMERTVQGSRGDVLNTERFHGMNRRTAELVNDMDLGISRAVEKSVKDERMRTELIANVSHDVRTPLTSIINYVDLLKKEPIESENAHKYLQVLDEKSARLKQLTEDLVEASRITSGNVSAELVRMSATELVQQIAAEYEEKFAAKELTLILSLPEDKAEDSFIGDSRYVWRVISNLFSNLCKYAMPHTRVYFSMFRTPEPMFRMELKNISEYPLNIPPEELTERFVRGDASRGTEGNGLGLSIAQSLMNVMHGTLEIKIDGDLFKVVLNFSV